MSMQLSSALEQAKQFRVFPCRPNGKIPVLKDWPNRAANDPLAVAELWAEHSGDCNVGIVCGDGLIVVDVDCKGGMPGFKSLAKFPPLPATRTTRTPTGGAHFFLRVPRGLRVQNSVGVLADGIDIRAAGGYVIAPGSIIDGKPYVLERDVPMADAPDWLLAKLTEVRVSANAETGRYLGDLDNPGVLEWAKKYVRDLAPNGFEGARNNTAFIVAEKILDRGISKEKLLELMLEWNDAKCFPPLPDDEIEKTCRSAAGPSRQLVIGVDNPTVGFEPVVPPPRSLSKFLSSITDYTNTREGDAEAPRLPWLAANRIMRRNLTSIFAPGATGKSLLMLEWAVAMALGPEAGALSAFCGLEVRERCRVLVINAEDETAVMKLRLGAVCDEFNIPRELVWRQVKLQSGKDPGSFRFRAAIKDARTGEIKSTPEVSELIEYCKAERIDVIIIDPLVRTHTANENDNGEMQQVADIFEHVAVEANAAVVLPHHTKKPGRGGYAEMAGNADAGRGATAIKDTSRVALTLFPMSEAEGEKLHIPAHTRHRYVRLDDAKMNFALAGPAAEWLMKKTVTLANGEQTGVLAPVQLGRRPEILPSPLEVEDVYAYLREITKNGDWQKLSADPQAPKYISRRPEILPGLDPATAPAIISAALSKLKDQGRAELVGHGRPKIRGGRIPERWRAVASS